MDCEFAEFLDLNGYQVSQQKAQLIKEKEAICRTPRTTTQSYLQASSVRLHGDCLCQLVRPTGGTAGRC